MQNRSKIAYPAVYMDTRHALFRSHSYPPQILEQIDVTFLHFHSLIEIGLCARGQGFYCDDEGECPFGEGDVQIVFPFQNHMNKSDRSRISQWHWTNLDPAAILEGGSFTNIPDVQCWIREEMGISGIIDREKYPRIYALARELVEEAISHPDSRPHHREYVAGLFLTLLVELCQQSRELPKLRFPENRRLKSVAPALNAIKEGLAKGKLPAVSQLSEMCFMSPAGFRRVFQSAVGQSPRDYIITCAIRSACRMLVNSEKKIIDISEAVGFESVSGFGRSFLLHTGMTPTAYRAYFAEKE